MKTLTISLSAQQILRLQGAVKSGAYASNSEVVRDALRLWEEREERRQASLEALRAEIRTGIESGPAIPADEVFARLEAKYGGSGGDR
ncbi:type II toxin-antitoxin system ParD family antitoxin [Rhizobium sp. PAMB 3182]